MASYCQDSSCGTVNYRPYVGGKIRWRYGTEPWQEIKGTGLTYTTKVSNDLVGTGGFKLIYQVASTAAASNGDIIFVSWQPEVISSAIFNYTTIDDYCLVQVFPQTTGCIPNNEHGLWMYGANINKGTAAHPGYHVWIWSGGQKYAHSLGRFPGLRIVDFIATNSAKQKTKCEFKIFQNGTQIRTETRATCPEVQILPAGLSSDIKSLKILKAADLERIEVNNTGIPPECLNIYTIGDTSEFKAQICSDPGTPPPQYEVICCAPCESCPAGTCAIECGNQICCYGANGISVKSINLANYCRS